MRPIYYLKQIRSTRLAGPYVSNCTDSWGKTNYTDWVENATGPYSLVECQRACLFSTIAMECNCFHPLYLDYDDQRKVNDQRLEPCDLANFTGKGWVVQGKNGLKMHQPRQ